MGKLTALHAVDPGSNLIQGKNLTFFIFKGLQDVEERPGDSSLVYK